MDKDGLLKYECVLGTCTFKSGTMKSSVYGFMQGSVLLGKKSIGKGREA